jgi:natural product biosynthesis luciferase-like monooxygenase protein
MKGPMNFSIMFFSSPDEQIDYDKYKLVREATRFADSHQFTAVWTPERHLHRFGGLFPNPSVMSAGLATITQNIGLRAGSVISPLHNPIRIAEEWSLVDNLSNGRVGISFGSGWNVDDFIFAPERYSNRQACMYEQIETVKALWSGESVAAVNTFGKEVRVRIYPRPIQKELPIWITSSGNAETFARAGAIGANLLTHLIGQDVETLAEKIGKYREARATNDFEPESGVVTLMLHTFLANSLDEVLATVAKPFREYLRSAVELEHKAAKGGGSVSGGRHMDATPVSDELLESLLDVTFERYFSTASLMGTIKSCEDIVWRMSAAGVDEIACLLDFGVPFDQVMRSLELLNTLRGTFTQKRTQELGEFSRSLQ